jgi:hypothetical protein
MFFSAMKIYIEVFSVVTPCSVAVGYRRFAERGLHLQCDFTTHYTTQRHNPEDLGLKDDQFELHAKFR